MVEFHYTTSHPSQETSAARARVELVESLIEPIFEILNILDLSGNIAVSNHLVGIVCCQTVTPDRLYLASSDDGFYILYYTSSTSSRYRRNYGDCCFSSTTSVVIR